MKRVLLIAYHYPPVKGSSGLQRTLAFSRYLTEFGWQPHVLTVNTRAYSAISDEQLVDIPSDCHVTRAFALDASRHLAIYGRFPSLFAMPDRWISWWLGGVASGLRLIRKFSPDVIFSTYPIATAHLIGMTLSKISGIPWVADFRDVMTEGDYPTDYRQRQIYEWIERHTLNACRRAVFTTPGAKRLYASRYPALPEDRLHVIANGYDEAAFNFAEKIGRLNESRRGPLKLLHSGILYPEERDPRCFYAAIARLKNSGQLSVSQVQIILRASGHDEYHQIQIDKFAIQDIVRLGEPLPYQEALCEMISSDGLLLFQADNCNHQIPAKLYEYIRAGRPIFSMTDSAGDTAMELRNAGQMAIVPLDNEEAIEDGLAKFVEKLWAEDMAELDVEMVSKFNRRSRTKELAQLLDAIS